MDSAAAEKPVRPLPALPRAIGTLNITFGCFLFLCGLGCLKWFGPAFAQNSPFKLDPGDAQNLYDQIYKELIHDLEMREAATRDETQKRRLKEERLALATDHRSDVERGIDLKAINRDLLWSSWYVWADVVTGPILNLLMLAAGIGLTQFKEWARKMALWVAALKIVRLIALTLLLVLVVIPHTARAMEAIAATKLGEVTLAKWKLDHAASAAGPSPYAELTVKNVAPTTSAAEYLAAILVMGFGLIYPAITLAVLTRPGAGAACSLEDEDQRGDDAD
jgi:hypothetical protein